METLSRYFAVAAGGAVGAVLRYYLNISGLSRTGQPFPTATFVINVTGCFIIGFFLTLAEERIPINPHLKLAIAVGFVGAYTTFSTFEYETVRLIDKGKLAWAFAYVVLSFALGFGAVIGGILLARQIEQSPIMKAEGEIHLSQSQARNLAALHDPTIDVDPVSIVEENTDGV